jgi:hypothetical protein
MILLCSLPVLTAAAEPDSAKADNLIEPGQWKVTASSIVNGAASPPQAKARCLTPEQVGDLARN